MAPLLEPSNMLVDTAATAAAAAEAALERLANDTASDDWLLLLMLWLRLLKMDEDGLITVESGNGEVI